MGLLDTLDKIVKESLDLSRKGLKKCHENRINELPDFSATLDRINFNVEKLSNEMEVMFESEEQLLARYIMAADYNNAFTLYISIFSSIKKDIYEKRKYQ